MLNAGKMGTIQGIYMTCGVAEKCTERTEIKTFINDGLQKFFGYDWGCLCDDDKQLNEMSLLDGNRIMGVYEKEGFKIWIIADAADNNNYRNVTVLLPEEY